MQRLWSRRRFRHGLVLLIVIAALMVGCATPSSKTGGSSAPPSSTAGGGGTLSGKPIKVGVLFSLSGTIAIIERSLHNATLLAIDKINTAGGINGRPLEPVIEDYASEPAKAVEKAKKLILQDRVPVTLGGYTSASRKSVLPVFERENSLFLYPTLYEGQECHPNIFYTGQVPNQQLTPFVPWIADNIGKDFFLIGSDYIYPHETNRVTKELIKQVGGRVVGEEYVPLGHSEFSTIIAKIRAAKPSTVFSTLVGDSVPAFYKQYRQAGITAAQIPITTPITTEQEIQAMGPENAVGHYTSASYFQSVSTPENQEFVRAYKAKYGQNEATNFVMEAAYFQTLLLGEALKKVGDNFTAEAISKALIGQQMNAPSGQVKILPDHHTALMARIGKVNDKGQFEIVWESKEPIIPEPWFTKLYPTKNAECPTKAQK